VITFVLVAAAMVAAALAWVLVPLLRGGGVTSVEREASNVAILRDQLRELDADLANSTLSREQYDHARAELERRVLDESKAASAPVKATPSAAAAWTAAIVAGALPIAALVIYVALGNFDAFSPIAQRDAGGGAAAGARHDISPEQIDKMIAEVVARLEKEPGNVQGWTVLARTYYALKRYPEAMRAFERAVALAPQDASLLADYADVLAATQGGSLQGKPLELVDRALAADPTQWKALALAGTAAFDRKDYAKAVAYWEQMKASVPPGSAIAQSIDSSIAEARELGGLKADAPSPTAIAKAPAAAQSTPAPKAAGSAEKSVAGTIKLAPALAAKASPGDTLFIFARAAQGPKMPLAIIRKQVRDLPVTFTLDDSMAMAPNMALSNFGEVVVGARISRSGQAMPQSGDLEGQSAPVKVGTRNVDVVIGTAIP
jgi:cytochrome c-type biogenesis protein CcmH